MELKAKTLHPAFLNDLLDHREHLLPIVEKYGTHYYTSADMGGKLVMMSSISTSLTSSTSSRSVQQSTKMSFSAKVLFGFVGLGLVVFVVVIGVFLALYYGCCVVSCSVS